VQPPSSIKYVNAYYQLYGMTEKERMIIETKR